MNRIQGKLLTSERGFGMIELIIAMAIFMLVATGGVTAVLQAFNVNRLGKEEAFANLYAQEGIEGVLSIKNRDFSNLSEGTFGLSSSGGQWNFSGPFDTNDKYRREVTIAQGQRDGSGSIVDSGGTVDSDLFKITSNVTWNFSPTRINSVDLVTYLTQWDKSIISASVLARIAYYDESNKDLKYAQCSSNCTNASNWDIVAVDSTNDVGEYTSLVFQNGSPRISYHYKDSLDLRYAQCSADCALSTNWTTITIDSGGDTGQFTSIGADGTKVGIAYYNLSNKDLKYAQCSSNCTVSSNWSNTVVDASGETGTYASLAFSSGNPRISYYDESNKDLKYAQCNTSCTSGSSAWAKVAVDAPATTGLHTSMAIDSSGNPRISYFRESGTRLKYAECNSNCTVSSNWSSGDITGPPGSRGKFSSLHLDGGRPRVSYYNESAKDLEFISCETGCTSSGNWTRITIQSLGDVGQYTSLKIK